MSHAFQYVISAVLRIMMLVIAKGDLVTRQRYSAAQLFLSIQATRHLSQRKIRLVVNHVKDLNPCLHALIVVSELPGL